MCKRSRGDGEDVHRIVFPVAHGIAVVDSVFQKKLVDGATLIDGIVTLVHDDKDLVEIDVDLTIIDVITVNDYHIIVKVSLAKTKASLLSEFIVAQVDEVDRLTGKPPCLGILDEPVEDIDGNSSLSLLRLCNKKGIANSIPKAVENLIASLNLLGVNRLVSNHVCVLVDLHCVSSSSSSSLEQNNPT